MSEYGRRCHEGRITDGFVRAAFVPLRVELRTGIGGGMTYSNNAENIYSFRINRVGPLHIPLVLRLSGPFRYDFLVGPLQGHIYPNSPRVHVEKVSFRPRKILRSALSILLFWGGKGHEPITLPTFLRSFVCLSSPDVATKNTSGDPGARFGAFACSYRLPFVGNRLTFYADSEAHDDVSPLTLPGSRRIDRDCIFSIC
jgi:hypothetical protein